MIHIKVLFHTNQYQACAWGNHHSEGVIDWPPAPFRILRSLVAGQYNVELSEKHLPTFKTVLHKLAAVLPSYTLPPIAYIQHRSPRPQVNPKTAKVEPGKTLYSAGMLMSSTENELYIHWPVDLSEVEELVLTLCLEGITYFGRKESVASLSLVEDAPIPNTEVNPKGTRIVTIADPAQDAEALWKSLNLSAQENYAEDRSAVFPGIKQITYQMKEPALPPRGAQYQTKSVTLSVTASSKLPFNQSLKLTHRLHQALVSHCPAPVFTGQEMGEYAKDHDHTILQCVPDRSGRYVEQIQMYCHWGYAPEALAAISTAIRYGLKGVTRGCDVSLAIADIGRKEEAFTNWESVTPFFLVRCPAVRRGKPRMLTEHYQKDSPEHQVLQYLQYLTWLGLRGIPTYREQEDGLTLFLDGKFAAIVQCKEFDRFWTWEADCRRGKKVGRKGYFVQIQFATPVIGPIAIGYAAHYGLGTMRGCRGVEGTIAQDTDAALPLAI